MGIALLAVSSLARPLTALHHWWSLWHSPSRPNADLLKKPVCQAAPRTQQTDVASLPLRSTSHPCLRPMGGPRPAGRAEPTRKPAALPALSTPPASAAIRVLRSRGRMVIAGRMSDVCAELERLAACEPQH